MKIQILKSNLPEGIETFLRERKSVIIDIANK